MTPRKTPRATAGELAIMRILWEQGPCTVREVWDALEHGHRVGYTTVLKQLQMLQEKGFVSCNDRSRSNIYKAKMTEDATQRGAAKELTAKLYRGSSHKLMLHVLSDNRASREELLEISRIIDKMVAKE